ncbi:MAG: DUF5110 domain-containing protein, partial [Bdellovibrionales bacterium]|nr:DUF5110 domain-containing protein [Bdellovibrionales bacterium]
MFHRSNYFIQLEVWQSDLVHFKIGSSSNPKAPIWVTPSVLKERRNPSVVFTRYLNSKGEETIETDQLLVTLSNDQACIDFQEKKFHFRPLTRICGRKDSSASLQVTMDSMNMKQVYGLGQQLDDPRSDGGLGDDWIGRRRESPGHFGNFMKSFIGGAAGDTQIPIMYAMGEGILGYGIYFDSLTKLSFDFQSQPWKVSTNSQDLNGFFISGPDLKDWRSDYLELTGKPLVPPRKMFGLWVSEYGYDNWQELESKLNSLKAKGFPIDGFVMDLQWFGGIRGNTDNTPMGKLEWDENQFPQPARKIAELERDHQIGLILIEESYVGKALDEHRELSSRQFLAKDCVNCGPTYIDTNPWWGKGGMIDWSNPMARSYWAENKRKSLVDMGVMGHWTDLGEPEMYQPWSWYYGWPELNLNSHASIHNYFSFLWHQGIVEGYAKFHTQRRPFILSRSSAPGSQRLGVGMWSADIGTNMPSLAAHLRAQMHMSLSGFDYYGSDIGGFHRGSLDGDLNMLYTQWFANSALLDVPVRPHVENTCNCKETAPDRIGHEASNLANLKLRYQLSPYYYSLAHAAYENGEPLFPPLFYYFQKDLRTRSMAHQKMIGPFMMMGIMASYTQNFRQVYLPEGSWYDYYTNRRITSNGEWITFGPLWKNGIFHLPLYVREGAVIPVMDENLRHLGKGSGLAAKLKIYPSPSGGKFLLREDDGESTAYMKGAVRRTEISHRPIGSGHNKVYDILIGAGLGTYLGAPAQRAWKLDILSDEPIESVAWNGHILARIVEKSALTKGSWHQEQKGGPVSIWLPEVEENIDK